MVPHQHYNLLRRQPARKHGGDTVPDRHSYTPKGQLAREKTISGVRTAEQVAGTQGACLVSVSHSDTNFLMAEQAIGPTETVWWAPF